MLVRARENLHLERPELAAQADISYPMLANIEAGRRRASDDIIERLAPVLGLRADRLRHVRNALTHGLVQTGGDVSSYLCSVVHQSQGRAERMCKAVAGDPLSTPSVPSTGQPWLSWVIC